MSNRRSVNRAGKSWYAVMTGPRAEGAVAAKLKLGGFEVLYLHYWGTIKHARKISKLYKPYYPPYLFVRTGDEGMYKINTTHGVATIVHGPNRMPFAIPDADIRQQARKGDENGLVTMARHRQRAKSIYQKGQKIDLMEGPFAGLCALVEVDNEGMVAVWVELFNSGQVRMTVSADSIRAHGRSP